METWPSLKDTTSSSTGELPLPMVLIHLGLEFRLSPLCSSLPLIILSSYQCHNSVLNLVIRTCHSLHLFVESSRDSGPTPFIQDFVSWLIITIANMTTVDDLLILKPLNFLTSSLPVTFSLAMCSHGHTRVYTHKMFLWWKILLFRKLASSLPKQHYGIYKSKRTGEFYETYRWCYGNNRISEPEHKPHSTAIISRY